MVLGHPGYCSASGSEMSVLRGQHSMVMVRSDLSIGGLGVWKVEGGDDLGRLGEGVSVAVDERLFVLQPLLEVMGSPNVQYEIGEEGAELLGVSGQEMTQSFAFGGNSYPSVFGDDLRLLEQGERVGRWLFEAGYRGIVGIDFIVTNDEGGGGEVFIVEINPRVNTSTFPLMMGKRLGKGAFRLMTGIRVEGVEGFGDVAGGVGEGLMFDVSKGYGMVPLMVPTAGRGVLDAMVFGDDLAEVDGVCKTLLARLKDGVRA